MKITILMRLTLTTTLLAALLSAGCATMNGDIAPVRNAWMGASYEEVVSRWGTPVRSTSFNDGRMVYTWVSEGTTSRNSIWPSIGIAGGRGGVGVGVGVGVGGGSYSEAPVTCERTMIFQKGRVVDQTWYGPTDFCSTFRRG